MSILLYVYFLIGFVNPNYLQVSQAFLFPRIEFLLVATETTKKPT